MGTYTYSRTFQTSEKVRLTCDGFRGDFRSINWNNSGYSTSGDDVALVLPSKVTITMQKVTATWFNNAGGCSYKFYIKLYTPNGTFQSSTKTYEWPAGGGTNTISFDISGVTGAWTRFEVWGQNWTMSEKKTEYPYVYWFNNSAGTVTVKYVTETSTDGAGLIVGEDGKWKSGEYYVWKTTNPTTYYYPQAKMTSNSSQNCVVSTSSSNSTYPEYSAFNKQYDSLFRTNSATPPQWIQITIPKALYNIKVKINARNPSNGGGPISGIVYGSNDGGTTLTQIGSFSGYDPTTTDIYETFTVVCTNSTTAYNTVRVHVTEWYNSSSSKLAIREILIYGTDIGSNGDWIKAEPLVWKTENPITYTYPSAAMTTWFSQNCLVCASSESSATYAAWKAFDKDAGNNWASSLGKNDPNPWIQISLPRPLYNISVKINNDSGSTKGPIDGIIYGSNDTGVTLTQIGSFSGRSTAKSASTTHQCNNTTTPYTTVRISPTSWGSSTDNNVDIGEIYISGTDIGTNGGWAGIKDGSAVSIYKSFPGTMSSNVSNDCMVEASSVYDSTNYAWDAFDNDLSDPWASLKNSSAAPEWIQLTLPYPVYRPIVRMYNCSSTIKAPCSGKIFGSNDGGTTLVQIGSYDNRPSTKSAITHHICSNTSTAYQTIRIQIDSWYNTSGTVITSGANLDLGEMRILGTMYP